ncbi:hypothetical protein CCACVL1_14673 [Corchorus capsularis]|uniref:Uncharacterized protein n=1 Tax=Corchorus capsularis TaxID=210143 RepID=A0A1R3I642_COCAP|nr:hypothetical protein CCACVL1_14673 [Corchorus capsularis]
MAYHHNKIKDQDKYTTECTSHIHF